MGKTILTKVVTMFFKEGCIQSSIQSYYISSNKSALIHASWHSVIGSLFIYIQLISCLSHNPSDLVKWKPVKKLQTVNLGRV